MLAYRQSWFTREQQDLDLFVPPKSLASATALIESAGYRRYEPPPNILPSQMKLLLPIRKDFGYFHEESQLEIELHWRLLSNPHLMADTTVVTSSVAPCRPAKGHSRLADARRGRSIRLSFALMALCTGGINSNGWPTSAPYWPPHLRRRRATLSRRRGLGGPEQRPHDYSLSANGYWIQGYPVI